MTKQLIDYVALNAETVKELKAGDKVIYLGDSKISDDGDMVVGQAYEITNDFGKDGDIFVHIVSGGYAGFTDGAGDECAITIRTANGFAKFEGGNDNA